MSETQEKRRLKSVDLALEWSKQLITLCSASLVLSSTFVSQIFGLHIGWIWLLLVSWLLLLGCIVSGILFLGALSAMVESDKTISVFNQPARTLALVHFGCFIGAFGVFAVFASLNLIATYTTWL